MLLSYQNLRDSENRKRLTDSMLRQSPKDSDKRKIKRKRPLASKPRSDKLPGKSIFESGTSGKPIKLL